MYKSGALLIVNNNKKKRSKVHGHLRHKTKEDKSTSHHLNMKNRLLFLFFFILKCSFFGVNGDTSTGKTWALLVAGSSGYYNYRHQADLCHAYQILHGNGIPDEQIIVMMFDDIANNQDNPTPGEIINYPGGPNVYKGVPKDYTGEDVNPQVFLDVLKGNSEGVKGIGSQRVIKSGPNDNIFVNFVDHGGPGVLIFPNDTLPADDLISTINLMSTQKKFKKMVLYIEACYSGSMFDDILRDDINVFVMTAADPNESSFACFYDEKRQTYLADVFSFMWINNSYYDGSTEDLNRIFERVRHRTNTSHVELYGDLDIGNSRLRDFIGYKTTPVDFIGLNLANIYKMPTRLSYNDVVDNIDARMMSLVKKHKYEKDDDKRMELKKELRKLDKIYTTIDALFERLVRSSVSDPTKISKVNRLKHKLGNKNFPCYKKALKHFSSHCLSLPKNPYARKHLYKLVNLCEMTKTEDILKGISQACGFQLTFAY